MVAVPIMKMTAVGRINCTPGRLSRSRAKKNIPMEMTTPMRPDTNTPSRRIFNSLRRRVSSGSPMGTARIWSKNLCNSLSVIRDEQRAQDGRLNNQFWSIQPFPDPQRRVGRLTVFAEPECRPLRGGPGGSAAVLTVILQCLYAVGGLLGVLKLMPPGAIRILCLQHPFHGRKDDVVR